MNFRTHCLNNGRQNLKHSHHRSGPIRMKNQPFFHD
nr:MAG TPA: hypothetical protein [Caudoviricetes sp.]